MVSILILLSWAVVLMPRLVQSLTAPKYRTTVDEPLPYTALAALVERGVELLLIAWCLLIVLRGLRSLPGDRRTALVFLMSPWIFMVCRDLYVDTKPKIATLLWPVVIIAIWILRPRLERLALLGWLVGFTAVLAIVMAFVLPEKGILSALGGSLVEPDKQILSYGILIGPFTDGNNLGQFLSLGLPAILLIRRPGWRLVLAGVTVFAIVFSSSRSSIAAALLSLVAVALLSAVPRITRVVLAGLIITAAAAAIVLIPVLNSTDEGFTNRGFIWRVSLGVWMHDAPVIGNGSRYYTAIGDYANPLGGNAFHGHNQFVQTVVTGGLIYLVLTAAMLAVLGVAAARWVRHGRLFPTVFLLAFFVSCTLEVSFGTVDRGFLFAVTTLPMAWIAFAATPQAASTTPSSRASALRSASSSLDSSSFDMRLPSVTTTTPSTSLESARASAARNTGGAFTSTRS